MYKRQVNILWGLVPRRPRGARGYLQAARSRAIPFLMVFLFGFMLSAAVLVDTVLALAQSRLAVFFPELAEALPSLSRIIVPVLTFVTVSYTHLDVYKRQGHVVGQSQADDEGQGDNLFAALRWRVASGGGRGAGSIIHHQSHHEPQRHGHEQGV